MFCDMQCLSMQCIPIERWILYLNYAICVCACMLGAFPNSQVSTAVQLTRLNSGSSQVRKLPGTLVNSIVNKRLVANKMHYGGNGDKNEKTLPIELLFKSYSCCYVLQYDTICCKKP